VLHVALPLEGVRVWEQHFRFGLVHVDVDVDAEAVVHVVYVRRD
jgi:hypothetical protein